jgi:tRNA (adenine37-N6)-methyltransferase
MYASSDHRMWSPVSTISWLTIALSLAAAAVAAASVTFLWNDDNDKNTNKTKNSTNSLWFFYCWKDELVSRIENTLGSRIWSLLPKFSFSPFIFTSSNTKEIQPTKNNNPLLMTPIGTVSSIYRLCVGTPRQGMLAPNARGRIELTIENAMDMIQGLEGFSHIWIIFVFHLNTTPSSKTSTNQSSNSSQTTHNKKSKKTKDTSSKRHYPTKISPPALGGTEKVGIFSTRTPHRVNPIGMTLCKLDSIMTKHTSQNQKRNRTSRSSSSMVVLHVSGLDLVDGTPVLDIKPYVPHYDSVPEPSSVATSMSPVSLSISGSPVCSIPDWVSQGLSAKRTVQITENARQHLISILQNNPYSLEHFGPHRGDDCILTTVAAVWKCIEQVLSIDVRSEWQTQKVRLGASHAELSQRIQEYYGSGGHVATIGATNSNPLPPLCSQQIDNLLIYYTVEQPQSLHRITSKGSGAEDQVTIHAVELLVSSKFYRLSN